MKPSSAVLVPVALVVAAMVSIQSGAAIAKLTLFPAVGAEGTTALRVVLAAAILLVVWRPWRAWPSRAEAKWIALYGAVLGAMNLSFYIAIKTIPLGVAVALEFAGPLAVAVAGSRSRLDGLWVGLAAVGVVALLPLAPLSTPLDPAGLAFALAAGLFWALYIVFGQKAGAGGAGRATSLGMVVAALVVLPVGLAHAGAALVSPSLLPAALAVAALSSALPYSLEMGALRRLPTRTFGVLMSLEPALASLSGLVLLGERLSLVEVMAVAAIMAASLGAAMTAKAAPATPG